MSVRVLHVLPALNRGGGSRSPLALIRALDESGSGVEHRIAALRVLEPAAAERAGSRLLAEPGPEELAAAIEAADAVHVHFWNSPEVYEFLRSPMPECRLVIWSQIGGGTAPQLITRPLADLADELVASTPGTASLPALAGREVRVIPQTAELDRVEGRERAEHEGFVVAYVGTVDPAKMHPRFAELSAAVEVEGARFVVCGSGDGFRKLAEDIERLGQTDRFVLRGYVEDVGGVLAEADVFGYPLAPDNYSAGELVLAEAMHAGVPPVVLPYGGAADSVEDGVSGLVVSEADYPRAIERLAGDENLRARLAAGAREHVARHRSPAVVAAAWAGVYEDLMQAPKRPRGWRGPTPANGAEALLAGLDGSRPELIASRDGDRAADELVASAPPGLVTGDGGILDYRRRHPRDPHLRLWAGLVLERAGRPALAAGELAAAARMGIEEERVRARLDSIAGTPVAVGR